MSRISSKKLNDRFEWNKVVRIEPHYIDVFHSDDEEEKTKEIGHIDLVLENGERIRIDGVAYPSPPDLEDEEPLCTLRIRKAQWVDVK